MIFFLLIGCEDENIDIYPLSCDMENIEGDYFICNNNQKIKYATNQSSDFAKSGKHSAKIDHANPFGLVHTINDLKKGNQLIISVWEKANQQSGFLKLCKNDGTILQVKKRTKSLKEDQWELITLSYVVDTNCNSLKFYIHNESENPAYYDDLKIEVFQKIRKVNLGEENIQLNITNEDYELLAKNREIAINNGIIDKSLKKYINGTLNYKNKEIPIKLRFKGDWPDHLKDDKWSFRIKVRGNNTFKGLKSFSIQSPHTRTFLKEWIMHQIFKDEDILTTRYGFISVKLNGKSLGIYAYEEHFDKQLLEYNQRREAPILKFNEEGLWETRLNNPNDKSIYPYYEAAEVMPFKKNRTLKSQLLRKNLIIGNELMLKYKEFHDDLNEIFDLKKMAQFYALCDLGKIRHSYHWHNQRFYYNPITQKLEHIAFDCYAGIEEGIKDVIYGYSKKDQSNYNSEYLSKQIFNNQKFIEHYKYYLNIYSSEEYHKKIRNKYSNLADSLTKIIQQEFHNYQFDLNYLEEQAKAVRNLLPSFNVVYKNHKYDINYDGIEIDDNYFKSIGVKAYINNNQNNNIELSVENYHLSKVNIIGYGTSKNKDSIFYFKSPIYLNAFKKDQKPLEIKLPANAKYLFVKPNNTNKLVSTKINYWPTHSENLHKSEHFNILKGTINKSFKIDSSNKVIYLTKGNYTFNSPTIIPKGWNLKIEAGTSINQINNSFIISYSPVFFNGKKEMPIKISSTDKTGMGLVVLNTEHESVIEHVIFNEQQSPTVNNWTLTGAITFYESDVTLNYCSFNNNLSEDGLNIIRSKFNLKNCSFTNTLSDAFDADFCNGKISSCSFKSTGNDGIDISGSKVIIENTILQDAKDKAISSGERSYLKIISSDIKNANVAVASKDDSKIDIENIKIHNCNVGYAAFQKKPEFNPASIDIINSIETNIDQLFLIDLNSKINHLNDLHIGISHINVDSLYAPFKKGI